MSALEKMLDRKYETIRIYLARPEFSHIKIERHKAGKFVVNMNTDDLLRLRNLIARRPNHKYKEIKEEEQCQNIK